jgi:VWFA-related protein
MRQKQSRLSSRQTRLAVRGAGLALLAALLSAAAVLYVTARAQAVEARAGSSAQAGGAQAGAEDARVSVLFTALDREGKFITGLKPEDVRLSADGAPRQVVEFKRQTGVPLFLAVALDTSASQERVLPNTKRAADVFLKGMMVPGFDEAAVLTFAGKATLEQGMTGDVQRVRDALARVKFVPPPGYVRGGVIVGGLPPNAQMSTALSGVWDAVWLASRDVLSRSLGTGRRALLLITDGVDTSSHVKLEEAVASALQSEVVVYAIGVGDDKYYDGVDKGPLRKLAERTGGRAFFPKKVTDVPTIFTQIQQELLSQYVMTFEARGVARDGSFHKIKVEVVNPQLRAQQIQLAYPQGYYAGNTTNFVQR